MGGWCCFPGAWHLPAFPINSSTGCTVGLGASAWTPHTPKNLLFYACLHVLHKIPSVLRDILSFMLAYIFGGVALGNGGGVCLDPSTIEFVCHLLFYACLHVLRKIQLFSEGMLSFALALILGVPIC